MLDKRPIAGSPLLTGLGGLRNPHFLKIFGFPID